MFEKRFSLNSSPKNKEDIDVYKDRREIARLAIKKAVEADIGIVGGSLFGSITKGKSRPDSDVDLCVFYDPEVAKKKLEDHGMKTDLGPLVEHNNETTDDEESPPAERYINLLHGVVQKLFKENILDEADTELHVTLVPVGEAVTDAVIDFYRGNESMMNNDEVSNLARLFSLSVSNSINSYRTQFIEKLASLGEEGERFWDVIITHIVLYENARDIADEYAEFGPDERDEFIQKRGLNYPIRLDEARKKYSRGEL